MFNQQLWDLGSKSSVGILWMVLANGPTYWLRKTHVEKTNWRAGNQRFHQLQFSSTTIITVYMSLIEFCHYFLKTSVKSNFAQNLNEVTVLFFLFLLFFLIATVVNHGDFRSLHLVPVGVNATKLRRFGIWLDSIYLKKEGLTNKYILRT